MTVTFREAFTMSEYSFILQTNLLSYIALNLCAVELKTF